MSRSATARRQAPLAEAESPLPQGPETRVRILALLLGLSLGIVLLPALLLALAKSLAARRPARGLWYLSPATQDEIDALSPRGQRAVARLLAIIGWAMAGYRNRGMHPCAQGGSAPGLRPTGRPRAPPHPA